MLARFRITCLLPDDLKVVESLNFFTRKWKSVLLQYVFYDKPELCSCTFDDVYNNYVCMTCFKSLAFSLLLFFLNFNRKFKFWCVGFLKNLGLANILGYQKTVEKCNNYNLHNYTNYIRINCYLDNWSLVAVMQLYCVLWTWSNIATVTARHFFS